MKMACPERLLDLIPIMVVAETQVCSEQRLEERGKNSSNSRGKDYLINLIQTM